MSDYTIWVNLNAEKIRENPYYVNQYFRDAEPESPDIEIDLNGKEEESDFEDDKPMPELEEIPAITKLKWRLRAVNKEIRKCMPYERAKWDRLLDEQETLKMAIECPDAF